MGLKVGGLTNVNISVNKSKVEQDLRDLKLKAQEIKKILKEIDDLEKNGAGKRAYQQLFKSHDLILQNSDFNNVINKTKEYTEAKKKEIAVNKEAEVEAEKESRRRKKRKKEIEEETKALNENTEATKANNAAKKVNFLSEAEKYYNRYRTNTGQLNSDTREEPHILISDPTWNKTYAFHNDKVQFDGTVYNARSVAQRLIERIADVYKEKIASAIGPKYIVPGKNYDVSEMSAVVSMDKQGEEVVGYLRGLLQKLKVSGKTVIDKNKYNELMKEDAHLLDFAFSNSDYETLTGIKRFGNNAKEFIALFSGKNIGKNTKNISAKQIALAEANYNKFASEFGGGTFGIFEKIRKQQEKAFSPIDYKLMVERQHAVMQLIKQGDVGLELSKMFKPVYATDTDIALSKVTSKRDLMALGRSALQSKYNLLGNEVDAKLIELDKKGIVNFGMDPAPKVEFMQKAQKKLSKRRYANFAKKFNSFEGDEEELVKLFKKYGFEYNRKEAINDQFTDFFTGTSESLLLRLGQQKVDAAKMRVKQVSHDTLGWKIEEQGAIQPALTSPLQKTYNKIVSELLAPFRNESKEFADFIDNRIVYERDDEMRRIVKSALFLKNGEFNHKNAFRITAKEAREALKRTPVLGWKTTIPEETYSTGDWYENALYREAEIAQARLDAKRRVEKMKNSYKRSPYEILDSIDFLPSAYDPATRIFGKYLYEKPDITSKWYHTGNIIEPNGDIYDIYQAGSKNLTFADLESSLIGSVKYKVFNSLATAEKMMQLAKESDYTRLIKENELYGVFNEFERLGLSPIRRSEFAPFGKISALTSTAMNNGEIITSPKSLGVRKAEFEEMRAIKENTIQHEIQGEQQVKQIAEQKLNIEKQITQEKVKQVQASSQQWGLVPVPNSAVNYRVANAMAYKHIPFTIDSSSMWQHNIGYTPPIENVVNEGSQLYWWWQRAGLQFPVYNGNITGARRYNPKILATAYNQYINGIMPELEYGETLQSLFGNASMNWRIPYGEAAGNGIVPFVGPFANNPLYRALRYAQYRAGKTPVNNFDYNEWKFRRGNSAFSPNHYINPFDITGAIDADFIELYPHQVNPRILHSLRQDSYNKMDWGGQVYSRASFDGVHPWSLKPIESMSGLQRFGDWAHSTYTGVGRIFAEMQYSLHSAFMGIRNLAATIYSFRNLARMLEIAMSGVEELNAQAYRLQRYDGTGRSRGSLLNSLYSTAQSSRTTMGELGTLSTRILATGQVKGADEALRIAGIISKAAYIGGSTAPESRSALLQLSQGIASNQLGGDELRAIRENAIGITDILAKGLTEGYKQGIFTDPEFANVKIGDLKEIGKKAKLTADVVLKAFSIMEDEVNKQFSDMPEMFSQTLSKISNTWNKRMYDLNAEGRGLGRITKVFQDLQKYLDSDRGKETLDNLVLSVDRFLEAITGLASFLGPLFEKLTNGFSFISGLLPGLFIGKLAFGALFGSTHFNPFTGMANATGGLLGHGGVGGIIKNLADGRTGTDVFKTFVKNADGSIDTRTGLFPTLAIAGSNLFKGASAKAGAESTAAAFGAKGGLAAVVTNPIVLAIAGLGIALGTYRHFDKKQEAKDFDKYKSKLHGLSGYKLTDEQLAKIEAEDKEWYKSNTKSGWFNWGTKWNFTDKDLNNYDDSRLLKAYNYSQENYLKKQTELQAEIASNTASTVEITADFINSMKDMRTRSFRQDLLMNGNGNQNTWSIVVNSNSADEIAQAIQAKVIEAQTKMAGDGANG